MVNYINQLFPFLENSDFVRTVDETVKVKDIYCPIDFKIDTEQSSGYYGTKKQRKRFQAVRVLPCNVLLLNEQESVLCDIVTGWYGDSVDLNVVEYDYTDIACRIDTSDNKASVYMNGGYMMQDIASDVFVVASSNGSDVDESFLSSIVIQPSQNIMNFSRWLDRYSEEEIRESTDLFEDMLSDAESGKDAVVETENSKDYVYKWLDSYFSLPEGVSATQGGREVVPLLIGPTGVFKSATIKELCKKYVYQVHFADTKNNDGYKDKKMQS